MLARRIRLVHFELAQQKVDHVRDQASAAAQRARALLVNATRDSKGAGWYGGMSRAAAAVAVKLQCASENMALASSVIADTLRKGRRSGAAPAGDIFTKGSTLLNNVMAKVRL